MASYYLGPGDEPGSEHLDLYNAAGFKVLGWDAPVPADGETTRTVSVRLKITGADADDLWWKVSRLNAMLERARLGAGVSGIGVPVVFSMRPIGVTFWTYVDVVAGTLDGLQRLPRGTALLATLTLTCLPAGRGERFTAPLSPSGAVVPDQTLFSADIPGDLPALGKLTLVNPGSVVVNGVQVFSHSRQGMEAADYDPVIQFVPAGSASTISDATASGGSAARGASNVTWQTIATASRPTALTTGPFDVRLRVRDAAGTPIMPENASAIVTDGVFETGVVQGVAGGGTSTTTPVVIDGRSPNGIPAGSVIELKIASTNGAAISSIDGVGGGTWTLASDGTDDARVVNGTAVQINAYWLRTTTAITTLTQFTITWGATKGTVTVAMRRIAGLVASGNPVEQVAVDATGTASTVPTNSVTTTQAYQHASYSIATASTESLGAATNGYTTHGGLSSRLFFGSKTLTSSGTTSTSLTNGAFDGTAVYAATLVTYKAAAATVGSIGTGTWNLRVASEGASGALSAATTAVSVSVDASTDVVTVSWDAAVGASTGYRVYRDRGTGWGYFTTTGTTYSFTTESGITTGTPPSAGSGSVPCDVRLVAVLPDGSVIGEPTSSQHAVLANGRWEDLRFQAIDPAQIAALDGEDGEGWTLGVQIKNATAGIAYDVDIAWLLRRGDPVVRTEIDGYTLTTAGDWVIETRRDGVTTARLYQPGTSTRLAAPTTPIGQLVVGPGNACIGVRMVAAGGISDITATLTPTLELTPRYRILAGV